MFGLRRNALGKLPKPKRETSMPGVRRSDTSSGEALKNVRPSAPGIEDTSRLDEIFKEAHAMGKNIVVDTEGNIHERIKVMVQTGFNDGFDTYTWNTMLEINQMLNSNMDFINIGDIAIRRKSIIGVYKIEEKLNENES